MRIVHAGWFELGSVHGTHHALWQLARAQVAGGHQVSIVNLGWDVAPDQVAEARRHGVDLVGVPCGHWKRFWADDGDRIARCVEELRPDVAHLQYVRIPKFAALSGVLRRADIPYVISLHGGWKAAEMRRHRSRKLAYWHLVERAVHRGAAGIHFVTVQEQQEYYRHFGRPKLGDAVIANVVEPERGGSRWKGRVDPAAPSFASLGRYDVWHKGLDLAAAMTAALRRRGVQAGLHLYGAPVGRFDAAMRQLQRDHADGWLVDHGPVTGAEKFRRLASHDFYLQYSRFELFGMSLVEALGTGVPVILSEACDLARSLAAAEAALVIPMDPGAAAEVIARELERPAAMAAMAQRGRAWAVRHCSAEVVAAQTTRFYQRAIREGRSAMPAPARAAVGLGTVRAP